MGDDMTSKKQSEPNERGIKLMGEILAMVKREMNFDHRPSLTNTAEVLIREAVEARLEHRKNLRDKGDTP